MDSSTIYNPNTGEINPDFKRNELHYISKGKFPVECNLSYKHIYILIIKNMLAKVLYLACHAMDVFRIRILGILVIYVHV